MPPKSLGKNLSRASRKWEKERKVIWTRAKGSLNAFKNQKLDKKEMIFYLLLHFWTKENSKSSTWSSVFLSVSCPTVSWCIFRNARDDHQCNHLKLPSTWFLEDRRSINDPSLYFMVNSFPFCKGLPEIR